MLIHILKPDVYAFLNQNLKYINTKKPNKKYVATFFTIDFKY